MTLAQAFDQPNTWHGMLNAMQHEARVTDQRIGQAYFNTLYRAWPEVADLVRGSMADPFYADSINDPRMARFLAEIAPYFV